MSERIGRWARVLSFAMGVFLMLVAVVVIGGEIGFKLLHAFGLHGGHEEACQELYGLRGALFYGIAAAGVSFAFMAGAPGEFGAAILEGIAGIFRRGEAP